MKPAIEWLDDLDKDAKAELGSKKISARQLTRVQLDAVKEGMERASLLILGTAVNFTHNNSKTPQSDRDEELRTIIYAAAQKLTVEDIRL